MTPWTVAPGSSVHGDSPGKNTRIGYHALLQGSSQARDLPNPGIKPWSPTSQSGSLLSEPPGKPKNAGVSRLPLLQGIFPTQESNWVSCTAERFFTELPASPHLASSVVQILCFQIDSLSEWFTLFCEWDSKVPDYHCIAVYFSLELYLLLLHIVRCSNVKHPNICYCYIFMVYWPLYHSIMSLFVSFNHF